MKIVYLVPKELYDTKMSRVRFQQVAAIARTVPVVITGPGWDSWDALLSPAENVRRIRIGDDQPELVLAYKVDGLSGMRCQVATQFNEADDVDSVNTYVRGNNVSLVIFHHENDIPRFSFWPSMIQRVHIPHCAERTMYRDYGLPKRWDITVCGNMSEFFYPFRRRLRRLALEYFSRHGYTVNILEHPGYILPPRDGTVVGEDFAKVLNQSRVVFTCSMRFNYALAKYSEIAMCRALPVGDLPGERHEFFRKVVYSVEPYMTDKQIIRKIEDVLDPNEGILHVLTEQAYNLTLATSTMEHYAERFVAVARQHLEEWPKP